MESSRWWWWYNNNQVAAAAGKGEGKKRGEGRKWREEKKGEARQIVTLPLGPGEKVPRHERRLRFFLG
jgi:hypothetical protein